MQDCFFFFFFFSSRRRHTRLVSDWSSDVCSSDLRYGIVAFASSLDQVGPTTKTVRDCALLYRIIAGRDPCDSTTVELPEPVRIPEAEDLRGVRIGVPRELNEAEGIEPGVRAAVQ